MFRGKANHINNVSKTTTNEHNPLLQDDRITWELYKHPIDFEVNGMHV